MMYCFVALAGACLVYGLLSLRTRPAGMRLARIIEQNAKGEARPVGALGGETLPGWLMRFFQFFGRKGTNSDPAATNRLRLRLVRAGYRRGSALTVFLGGRVALAVLAPLPIVLSPLSWRLKLAHVLLALIGAAALGYVAPGWWVDRRAKHRQTDIQCGLPDALDLMVVCVQAGLGIVASMDRVVREMRSSHPILAGEFALALGEIRAGRSTSTALREMATRTGVQEMHALVAMLVQTERFGTSVADTLRVHADSLRSRRVQRAEEAANKAPIKMLFPTTLIFFATLVVSIGPAMLEILGFFRDH